MNVNNQEVAKVSWNSRLRDLSEVREVGMEFGVCDSIYSV